MVIMAMIVPLAPVQPVSAGRQGAMVVIVVRHGGKLSMAAGLVTSYRMEDNPAMLDIFLNAENLVTLLVLIGLEIVLSVDNLVFIAILSNKLPVHQQRNARRFGLGAAVIFRVGLLCLAAWLVRLTVPVFTLCDHGFSIRDMLLLGGGVFLIWKSGGEIRERISRKLTAHSVTKASSGSFTAAILQIMVIDVVFSIDSIITAVGLAQLLPIMIVAVLVAVAIMIAAADGLSRLINSNQALVMLALVFLVLIGVLLIAEGIGLEIDKNYLYAAMAFAVVVELLNMAERRAGKG